MLFKNNKICLNCNTETNDNYCGKCGNALKTVESELLKTIERRLINLGYQKLDSNSLNMRESRNSHVFETLNKLRGRKLTFVDSQGKSSHTIILYLLYGDGLSEREGLAYVDDILTVQSDTCKNGDKIKSKLILVYQNKKPPWVESLVSRNLANKLRYKMNIIVCESGKIFNNSYLPDIDIREINLAIKQLKSEDFHTKSTFRQYLFPVIDIPFTAVSSCFYFWLVGVMRPSSYGVLIRNGNLSIQEALRLQIFAILIGGLMYWAFNLHPFIVSNNTIINTVCILLYTVLANLIIGPFLHLVCVFFGGLGRFAHTYVASIAINGIILPIVVFGDIINITLNGRSIFKDTKFLIILALFYTLPVLSSTHKMPLLKLLRGVVVIYALFLTIGVLLIIN